MPSEQPKRSSGKVFAPTSTVDVPRMPKKQGAATEDEQTLPTAPAPDTTAKGNPAGAKPVEVDTTKTNWADSTQPAPDKQTARSSIL